MTATPRVRMSATDRQEQIIQEATRIIGQRGYFGFSIHELAASCGITAAGLLHHIGTKDHLLTAVLEARDERDIAALGEIVKRFSIESLDEPFDISLDDAVDILHRLVLRNASQPDIVRLYSVLRNESLYPDHPSYEFFRTRDARTLRLFRAVFEDKVADPASLARQVLALMGGLEEQWLRTPDDVDLVAEWDRGFANLLAGAARP